MKKMILAVMLASIGAAVFATGNRGNDGFVRKAGYAGMVDVGSDHERSKYANHCKVSG